MRLFRNGIDLIILFNCLTPEYGSCSYVTEIKFRPDKDTPSFMPWNTVEGVNYYMDTIEWRAIHCLGPTLSNCDAVHPFFNETLTQFIEVFYVT